MRWYASSSCGSYCASYAHHGPVALYTSCLLGSRGNTLFDLSSHHYGSPLPSASASLLFSPCLLHYISSPPGACLRFLSFGSSSARSSAHRCCPRYPAGCRYPSFLTRPYSHDHWGAYLRIVLSSLLSLLFLITILPMVSDM